MNILDIVKETQDGFTERYTHFKEFCQKEEYGAYWNKCVEAISDKNLLSHIIFCNDLFSIPPVKTFLCYYKDYFIKITGNENAELDIYVKKSVGAFWAMVFKFVLGYKGQKIVSVSMYDFFIVKTATCFTNPPEKLELE